MGEKDHVVERPRPPRPAWMSIEDYRRYPLTLRMREVEVDGRVLVTTMLSPTTVMPRALDALYALRWNIEVDWRTIKVTMAMDILRCRSPEMVRKEIAVHLLAYNLVRWSIATAAYLADVLPRTLSFTGAKRLLLAFAEQLRRCHGQRLTFMFATVLGAMASLILPSRPDRIEPRAKKRRPKPLPLLTIPRPLARQKIIAQRHARGLT
ncbi:MAG: transposase [Sulfurisoma sp.]|nr:transposase [Sulfurisoma sp.]